MSECQTCKSECQHDEGCWRFWNHKALALAAERTALRAEVEGLREALTEIGKPRYGLQGIQEDYGHDANAYNYRAKQYFGKLALDYQSIARRALATSPASHAGSATDTTCEDE